MEKDKLVTCKRCQGDACYEQHINEEVTTWLCFGCGFTTSTMMQQGSKTVRDLLETSPELYKEILFTDDLNKVWAPATITLPEKGMVFLDGTDKESWEWAGVKSISLTEEEINSGKYPKGQTVKMDMQNIKHFGQRDFIEACDVIGFFDVN